MQTPVKPGLSGGGVHTPGVCRVAHSWSVQVKCISHSIVCDMVMQYDSHGVRYAH